MAGRLPDKRDAILAGAILVFGRDGYARASIDAIAAEAGVSTRTLYNHFADKAGLFEAAIAETAAIVADAQIALIDRHLRKGSDLEGDLIALGIALATPMPAFARHFALMSHVQADAANLPAAALAAWRAAGPRRVTAELARHLAILADTTLLRIADAERAAAHFLLLVGGAMPFHHGRANDQGEIAEAAAAGVHAFLYGYRS